MEPMLMPKIPQPGHGDDPLCEDQFILGMAAYRSGQASDENPHSLDSMAALAWLSGFSHAEDLYVWT